MDLIFLKSNKIWADFHRAHNFTALTLAIRGGYAWHAIVGIVVNGMLEDNSEKVGLSRINAAYFSHMKYLLTGLLLVFVASCAHAQVVINEICAANGDVNYDPDFFNFPSWVELHNTNSSPVDINGYYLSDSADEPTRWQISGSTIIPANGFLIIWCDEEASGLHSNFSLDSDGEEVILSAPDGQLVDKIIFPRQYLNTSYGRTGTEGTEWNYILTPTPAASNSDDTGTIRLDRPDITPLAGQYASAQTVTLTHSDPAAEIRYTVDGSEPTSTSTLYSAPFTVTSTTSVKAKAFKASSIPSNTRASTFIINEHQSNLPVIALSTNPAYLNDNTIGIYVQGTNGIPGRGTNFPANWNHNWWRHFHMEYFSPDGERKFGESVDIRIHGGHSRTRPQKSFSVKARDKYGKKTISFNPFPNRDYESFGGLLLRNSGNDWDLTMFRDALMHNLLIGDMDVDYQDYQPAAVYINGQYWGILNVRERIDGDYFESNYDATDIDLLEGGGDPQEGTSDKYNVYMDSLVRRVQINNPETFAFIDRNIDVQEYINYQIANIYYGNVDWPGNNVTYWRPRHSGGKFRWVLWDMDYGFHLSDGHTSPTFPALEWATDPDNTEGLNKEWSTRHFRTLLQNPVFRNRFIQTMTTAIQTTFDPDRVIAGINDFQEHIRDEISHHQARWNNPANWEQHVQKLRDFAVARNGYMLTHTREFFGLDEQVNIDVTIAENGGGGFRLNGVHYVQNESGMKFFKNVLFRIEAEPLPGYAFKEWTMTGRTHVRTPLVPKEDMWKYFDQSGEPTGDWKSNAFDDSHWSSGQAQLGYGESDEKTVVGYGPDRNNKYITTYFRKTFNISSISNLEDVTAHVVFDDGVAVYINGIEVYRNNLPGGDLTPLTFAPRSYSPENFFHFFAIDKGLLHEGSNTIAVEVHQNEPTSSDLSFDLYLEGSIVGEVTTVTVTDAIFTGVAWGDVSITVAYEALPARTGIVINEFCATASDQTDDVGEPTDWIELYNSSENTIDIGGLYVTDDLGNKKKFRIPENSESTLMDPGTYLLLWADEEPEQGPLHIDIKLSSNGEAIGLYDEVGSELITLDEVVYGAVADFESFARIPNCSGPFTKTETLSPGAENPLISSVVGEKLVASIHPNPASDRIHVNSLRGVPRASIVDMLGRIIRQFDRVGPDESLDVAELNPGVYFITFREGGNSQTFRFFKK